MMEGIEHIAATAFQEVNRHFFQIWSSGIQ